MAEGQDVGARVRLSRSLEDYLEAVAVLVGRDGVARTRDVARRMGVAPSSANSAVNKLADKGLVTHQPYELIRLTEKGEQVGGAIRRRHELVRSFLTEVLGVPDDAAATDACQIEHCVSPATVEHMVAFMDFIKAGPNDRPKWLQRFRTSTRAGTPRTRNGSGRRASKHGTTP